MKTTERAPLPDQLERDRFCRELDTNFSVIAPAGVGKTTSIVERVLAIAEADRQRPDDPVLPRLVVVTYTRKAADEMLARVRTRIDEARPHPHVHAHLAQAFFGTIHSFCQRLLTLAGPLGGFPSEAEVATEPERLWRAFRLEEPDPISQIPLDLRRAFALHGQWENVFALAQSWPASLLGRSFPLPPPPPRIDGSEILDFPLKGRGKENIEASQANFREWATLLAEQGEHEYPLPCSEPPRVGSAKAFAEVWIETFNPLRQWRRAATTYLAAAVAEAFARYRRRTGQLTFDDLIQLARRLLTQPASRDLLRARNWRVILDEAQDTDPDQFTVLTELARPAGSPGEWLNGAEPGPQPGHFCMVGDMQQSIYSDRADLGRYQKVHARLLEGGGASTTFSVTMRCPVAVVDMLNATFHQVLRRNGPSSGQVDYVRLANPSGAARGQVVRHALPPPPDDLEKRTPVRLAAYAQAFAEWWLTLRPEDLGAEQWNEVAILCPRNEWLERLGGAIQAQGRDVQLVSRRGEKAGDPIHAWFAAVLAAFARPRDAFEIYGLLRDILGHSDHDLATFIQSHRQRGEIHPLRIDVSPPTGSGAVGASLAALHALWREVHVLPLFTAVDCLVDTLDLPRRLRAIEAVDPATIAPTLALLRHETAEAENAQMSLCEWADRNRRRLTETQEESPPAGDAVVLLTAHKSKGLGFKAVVLPAFFKCFGSPNDRYPVCELRPDGEVGILFDKNDRDQTHALRRELRRRELHQRLLYVALTRVKHTLVLLDDEPWWEPVNRTGDLFGDLLCAGAEGVNRAPWLGVPTALASVDHVADPAVESPISAAPLSRSLTPPSKFWRRVTPSSLQEHGAPPARNEPDQLSNPEFPEEARWRDPAAYGNWWHNMMEFAPWVEGEDAMRIHFQNALKECPASRKQRAFREVEAFGKSSLAAKLWSGEWRVFTEVPFLRGDSSRKIGYEGYIDLLAVRRGSREWLVVDWKTDRVDSADPANALRRMYGPQLAVYRNALSEHLGPNGKSGLYSTVGGMWITD